MPATLFEARKATSDKVRGDLIETLYREEQFFLKMPIEFIDELSYPYNVEKVLPGITFRKMNEAFPESTLIVQRPIETLKPLGQDSDTDILIAQTKPLQRARNARATMKAMGIKWIQTILYGNSPASRAGTTFDDVDGFDGLMKRLNDAPNTPQIVDNGASSGSDGSSVFGIRFGEDMFTGLMLGPSPGFSPRDMGELQTKPVFRTRIDAAASVAIFNGASVGWLKDITVATAIDIDKLDQMIDKIVGRPDILLMTKRTRTQLRKACRTLGLTLGKTLNEIGAVMETYGDIPIVISDAMIDTETTN